MFLQEHLGELFFKIGEHLAMASISLLLGVLIAVPLGIAISKSLKISQVVIGLASILQTIPSFALLALLTIVGVGKKPAIIALFLYCLLPILRNTYLGITGVDYNLVDAGRGMGMTEQQILWQIKLKMAMPVIMGGIRQAAVYVLAWTTLASYIGAGGLGDYIFTGMQNYLPEMIVAGTLPVTILALVVDYFLGKLEKKWTPVQGGDGLEQ